MATSKSPVMVPKVTKKSVTVDATPFISEVGDQEELGDIDVMVRVSASDKLKRRRVPIDLVAVLDVSDSNSIKEGAADKPVTTCKLDLLKRAMEFIVEQLDDSDSIAVVAFSNDSNAIAESTSKLLTRALAKESIGKLQAKGGTAFKPGLEQAVKILDGRSDSDRNRPGFILLLSDGDDKSQQVQWWDKKASSSSSDAARAWLKQYPVHTFGFGAAHDAKPLFFIAQESGGTYSFVKDRRLADATEALAVCLGGLKSVVAIDTHIQVTAASDSEAVEIGVGHRGVGFRLNLLDPTEAGVNFEVGTLYAGEVKSFHVKVCRKQCKKPKQKLLISARGRYRDATSKAAGAIDYELQLPMQGPVQHMPSSRLEEMLVRLKVLEKLNLFRGETNGLKTKLVRTRKELKLKPNDKALVDELHNDIKAMANDLDGDKHGAAYFYSWLSSHNMQRATTMGSPDKVVAAFLTQAMKDEQEAARKKKQLALADEAAAAAACLQQAQGQVVANTTMDSPDKGVSAPAVGSPDKQGASAKSTAMDSPNDKAASAVKPGRKKTESTQCVDKQAATSVQQVANTTPVVVKSEPQQQHVGQDEAAAAARVCMCRFLDLDPIKKRLELWGEKKNDVDVPKVSPESAAAMNSNVYFITATSRVREEPLDRINREMYRDIFNLVVEQVVEKMRCKCNCETR